MSAVDEPEVVVATDVLFEVFDGEIVEKSMSAEATWLGGRLHGFLWNFAEEHGIGTVVPEMMFILDAEGNQKRRPDVAMVAADRWPVGHRPPSPGDWEIVPDLAVEVVSPNDIYSDVSVKVEMYFRYGVRQVWVIDPVVQSAVIYDSPTASRILKPPADLDSTLVPGWKLPLAKLFGEPPPR